MAFVFGTIWIVFAIASSGFAVYAFKPQKRINFYVIVFLIHAIYSVVMSVLYYTGTLG